MKASWKRTLNTFWWLIWLLAFWIVLAWTCSALAKDVLPLASVCLSAVPRAAADDQDEARKVEGK